MIFQVDLIIPQSSLFCIVPKTRIHVFNVASPGLQRALRSPGPMAPKRKAGPLDTLPPICAGAVVTSIALWLRAGRVDEGCQRGGVGGRGVSQRHDIFNGLVIAQMMMMMMMIVIILQD